MQKNRVVILDMLRVFAIGLVILGHIGQRLNAIYGMFVGIPGFYYVSLGGIGVTIFLILSGMVLEMNYGEKKYTYFKFLGKRIRRIYVVYWLALIFAILVDLIVKNYHFDWQHFLWSFSGFQAFSGRPWSEFLIAGGWFIGVIVFMYVVFPWFSKWVKKNGAAFILSLLIISVVLRLLVGKWWPNAYRPQDWFPLCRVFEFGLGMWLVKIGALNSVKNFALNWQKPMAFLGEVSFPLYLAHMPLLNMIQKNSGIGIILLFLLLSLIVSCGIYWLDKKFNYLLNFYPKVTNS